MGSDEERIFWRRTLEEREQTDSDLGQALALMRRHGALDDTIERARLYGDQAITALAGFPDVAEKKALADVVAFCIERAH